MTEDGARDPFSEFRVAMEGRDIDRAMAVMADDVRFLSPVVHQEYVGHPPLQAVLTAVSTVFEDFRYTDSYAGDGGHVLAFSARVGDRDLQGVDILRGQDGVITSLTVMVRPYSAVVALRERMAALLG